VVAGSGTGMADKDDGGRGGGQRKGGGNGGVGGWKSGKIWWDGVEMVGTGNGTGDGTAAA